MPYPFSQALRIQRGAVDSTDLSILKVKRWTKDYLQLHGYSASSLGLV